MSRDRYPNVYDSSDIPIDDITAGVIISEFFSKIVIVEPTKSRSFVKRRDDTTFTDEDARQVLGAWDHIDDHKAFKLRDVIPASTYDQQHLDQVRLFLEIMSDKISTDLMNQ